MAELDKSQWDIKRWNYHKDSFYIHLRNNPNKWTKYPRIHQPPPKNLTKILKQTHESRNILIPPNPSPIQHLNPINPNHKKIINQIPLISLKLILKSQSIRRSSRMLCTLFIKNYIIESFTYYSLFKITWWLGILD